MGKTGGGIGTNQYGVRGVSQERTHGVEVLDGLATGVDDGNKRQVEAPAQATVHFLITENSYMLCSTHARKWRQGGWSGGMRRASASEAKEQGGVCIECQDHESAALADEAGDDGERECASCGQTFNLADGGLDFVTDAGGPLCLFCEGESAPE